MKRTGFRKLVDLFRRTPLHPQWLLGSGTGFSRELGELESGRVLDIGCADRWVQRRLAPGSQYIGLDYLDTGRAWYGACPDLFADAASLPLSDCSVDAVVLLEVLEHLAKPKEALAEIERVLRPRGRLLLSVPFMYPVHDAPQDFQRFTEFGLLRELKAAGLHVERIESSLGTAESAGLLASIAMAGIGLEMIRRPGPALILLPALALAVTLVNVTAWIAGRLLPHWPAYTAGYAVCARKP